MEESQGSLPYKLVIYTNKHKEKIKAPRGAFLLAIKLKISINYYAPRRAFSINIICALRRA